MVKKSFGEKITANKELMNNALIGFYKYYILPINTLFYSIVRKILFRFNKFRNIF